MGGILVLRGCGRFARLAAVVLLGVLVVPTAEAADEPRLRALLKARVTSGLSAQISALVADVAVRAGDRFRKGDTLVRFDCAVQRAQLQKAQAELMMARKTLAVKRDLARLNSAGGLEVETAEAAAAKAEAEGAMANAVVSYCVIRAPFDGRVVEVKVQAFEGASPGQKLMEVIDDGELEVEAIVPSQWLSWLKAGTTFSVRVDDATTPRWSAGWAPRWIRSANR